MKQKLLAGLAISAVFLAAVSAGARDFNNSGAYYIPPNNAPINGANFVNRVGGVFNYSGMTAFTTGDTLNYTNYGTLVASPGFLFENISTTSGLHRMAANFVNQPVGLNSGIISAGGSANNVIQALDVLYSTLAGNSKLIINATNIINTGTITMDASSLIKLTGKNVDLSYGAIQMSNPNSSSFFYTNLYGTNVVFDSFFNAGVLDYSWTARDATNPFYASQMLMDYTPLFVLTNRNYLVYLTDFRLYNSTNYTFDSTTYYEDSGIVNSNRFIQMVKVRSDYPFQSAVYISSSELGVEWQWTTTNWPDRVVTTNFFYLSDDFGEVTNIGVWVNGYINPQATFPTPTYIPRNYTYGLSRYPYAGYLTPATPGTPPAALFDSTALTNQYTAWQGYFTSATAMPMDVVNYSVTNMYGRIEISADTLNLDSSRITALNYLQLQSTNHFKGSPNAQIETPWADFNLRVTNGAFTVTNIIVPTLPHAQGMLTLYSSRWTNVVTANGITTTNGYHVLYVNNALQPTTTPMIHSLVLCATNTGAANSPGDLTICDVLTVTNKLTLMAKNLTIATNDLDAFNSVGELNIANLTMMLYPSNFPGLQNFTNWGMLRSYNMTAFGASASPLSSFVNYGLVHNQGMSVSARSFANHGLLELPSGSLTIDQADSALLDNGTMMVPNGAISIAATSLLTSNAMLNAGGAIDLYVTGSLTDGGIDPFFGFFTSNVWYASGSVNLRVKPATGDLLATTIYNTAPDYVRPVNYWAGVDRGRSSVGFEDNAAVGRLILKGGTGSVFFFSPVSGTNALYVDYIEFQGTTTNRDANGNYKGVSIDPAMTIYYADAVANNASVAEKLNGKGGITGAAGGKFVWVPSYAGTYSSTNLYYPAPDSQTHTFNAALVRSSQIDSDGDGIVNSADPTPILVSSGLAFTVTKTNCPPLASRVSWHTVANSTNFLYYKTSLTDTNWLLLTNFVSRSTGSTNVLDNVTSASRYYRVRLDVRQP